jgi:hypothetical protein
LVGRQGGMKPAGRLRGRENMMPAYVGQDAGYEKAPGRGVPAGGPSSC